MDRIVEEVEALKAGPQTAATREKLRTRRMALRAHRETYRGQFGA